MNTLIQAHNDKMNRLVNVSSMRRVNELDFFTECSIKYQKYLNAPLALNPHEGKKLSDIIKQDFIQQAQAQELGVIVRSTRLATDIKNMSQQQIKEDKKFISQYFSRLEKIQKLGGYLIVAVENIKPETLPAFIANYRNMNINGTNEQSKDRNMFMLAAWANLFDYFEDVKVEKGFTFRQTNNDEIAVLTQRISFLIKGQTFKKYLHKKNYVVKDFLQNKNITFDEMGKGYYTIYGEVDSTQVENGDLLNLYLSEVPKGMDLGETFQNGGIMQNATLQPQFFLGGTVMSEGTNADQDTSIKIPMYSVVENKLKRFFVKPINTVAINKTPAYTAEVNAHVSGLFAVASGDISVLSGYTNKRLGIDLPLGMNEVVTEELVAMYEMLSPEGKVGFVGNRYMFNTTGLDQKRISLVDAQKAFVMDLVLDSNLDIKLIQENVPGQPQMIKEILRDDTPQGKDLIQALNDNEMPIPEYYKNMLGITRWEVGMPVYLQKLPEQVTNLPEQLDEKTLAKVQEYM
ncbi:hypothetical protein CMK13_18020 [Candidatus Poribacteria bacterium]|nr:hypothetical protein [Candidatus Poribacteria bacterium]|tara:strand:+ start:1896 stop:3443 length:1548 start_codon:yes stop_codon:yes gene_type:complete